MPREASLRLACALSIFLSSLSFSNPSKADPADDAYARGDYQSALKYWQPMAESGDAIAQCGLGLMYENGQGVAKDYHRAMELFQKASAQGLSQAENNIGFMYVSGLGVNQDYSEARSWFEKAAARGLSDAQFNLGVMYASGQGVQLNYDQAVVWFHKAADQGNAKAELSLGLIYENGSGVKQDHVQAAAWLKEAAGHGNSDAQNDLGIMYSKGLGVDRDPHLALTWFHMAASQGNAQAISNASRLSAEMYAQNQATDGPSCPDRGVMLTQVTIAGVPVDEKALKQSGAYSVVNFNPLFSIGAYPGYNLRCRYADGYDINIPFRIKSISCTVSESRVNCQYK